MDLHGETTKASPKGAHRGKYKTSFKGGLWTHKAKPHDGAALGQTLRFYVTHGPEWSAGAPLKTSGTRDQT